MNERKIVPFNTGKVEIGRNYIPKPSLNGAFCIERQRAKRSPVLAWVVWCGLAFAALVLIAGRA